MKLKVRFRRFWRHNKRMVGMWVMAIQVLLVLIPPYNISDIILVAMAIAWLLVWVLERRADTLRRVNGIILHEYILEKKDHYKDLCKYIRELKAHIEDLCEHKKCEEEKRELLKRLREPEK